MKIIFTKESYDKIEALVTNCETEIMGLGKTEVQNGNVTVTDIIILDQEASAAHVEFDKEKLVDFLVSRVGENDSADWNLWWHSHAKMSCFWSGTDTGNIARMGETAQWIASVVFNHNMEYKARVDQFQPFQFSKDELPVTRIIEENTAIKEWALAQIAEKVKEPAPTVVSLAGTECAWEKRKKDGVTYYSQLKENEESYIDEAEKSGDMSVEMIAVIDRIEDRIDDLLPLTKREKKFCYDHRDIFDHEMMQKYYKAVQKKGEIDHDTETGSWYKGEYYEY